MMTPYNSHNKGFTLVEMLVVAPLVILLIGAFIALLINLTGEALSSRGADSLAYDVQNALTQIEEDVQYSAGFLAVNDISLTNIGQGYGDTTASGSTTNFTNVAVSGGSSASLIIKAYAINGNRNNPATSLVPLANTPNDCTDPATYAENTPMTIDIVYFVDTSGTLWRRTIMQENYSSASVICGAAPWQQPTCIPGYNAATRTHCKASDVKLLENVSSTGFSFNYYTNAGTTTSDTTAVNASATNAARDTALAATDTVQVDISVTKTIAGRDISRSGTIRATRMQ